MNKFYLQRNILKSLVLIFLFATIPISAQRIAAGDSHSIAIDPSGNLFTWGANLFGQLGNGNTTDSNVPVAVISSGVLAGKTLTAIAAGRYHSTALTEDGTVYSWGGNAFGQLGNGINIDSYEPIAVTTSGVLAGKTITAIAAGVYYSIALASDGTVYTWGNNNSGQLGNGTNQPSRVPIKVYHDAALSGKTITAISAGAAHSIALASDGTVYTWGNNFYGQLGNGNWTDSYTPTAVATSGVLSGKIITAISVGGSHSIALASDGTVYSWGYNASGQLGNGSNIDSNIPVAVTTSGVLSGKTITAISAGESHSIALASDGTVYSWGSNGNGQFGSGNTTDSNVPVAVNTSDVLSEKIITAIAGGAAHSIALASNGTVYTWGSNFYGQLGNGNNTDSNVPVIIDHNLFVWSGPPTPTVASENVISIFSNSYTSITGLDLNPDWGQSTVVTQEQFLGDNTLLYTGLDYQGIDFDANHQDVSGMDFVHVDFYSVNSTALSIYLISPGPVETPYALTVPTNGRWISKDIPLTEFSPVNLADVFQFKFEGNGDIYLDNIYFYRNTPTSVDEDVIPLNYSLLQNYPNPFNPTTSIKYSVSNNEYVSLKVYDILGNEVANLVNEQKSAGNYSVNFEASNLASGLYIYKIQAGSFNQVRKMMLLK